MRVSIAGLVLLVALPPSVRGRVTAGRNSDQFESRRESFIGAE
jgi:hypothetical protein